MSPAQRKRPAKAHSKSKASSAPKGGPEASESDFSGLPVRAARRKLLRWYDANKRDMPWRHTRDPYAIWISEAMLQQTRVETVIPYWERFLENFPDVETLASAPIDDVYAVWTGLGYYSRARNLKHAAETVVAEHDGKLPDTAEGLEKLKGIGRYTAGAIASIAFEREAPLIDGNVIRVFTRLLGIREDSAAKEVVERMWRVAGAIVRGERPGDLNQGLMELGATLCTPKNPHCLACPIRTHCDAYAVGDAESLPIKKKKAKPTKIRAIAIYLERDGKVLSVRRPETGLMAGLWELPGGEIDAKDEAKDRVQEILLEVVGLELLSAEHLGSVNHLFTHRRLTLEVFRAHVAPKGRVKRQGFDAHKWVAPESLLDLAHAGPTRKALALVGLTDETSARTARKNNAK
ncbi:MAG: A/G-specific adenine glycosylase [Opitutales bacterium TMED158]|nr:MAG: A/G-specific adenine glycosylase [Opitutales bacterium TMED158]